MSTKPTKGMFFKGALCSLLAAMAMTATSQAWWNAEWPQRKKITIDTTGAGGGIADKIGTAPLLVRLYDANFTAGSAKPDLSDLRFVAEDDKTVLPHHVERYDADLNEALIWVKALDVKPGGQTVVWMYYGNQGPKAVKEEDSKGGYDGDTALAWHFGEASGVPTDVTGNGNNADAAGQVSKGSMIAGGLRLDGKTLVTAQGSATLNWAANGTMTWSAWVNPSVDAPGAVIFSRGDATNGLVIGIDKGVPFVQVSSGGAPQKASGGGIPVKSWHHLAVVAEGPKMTLFVDGESAASVAAGLPALTTPITVGGDGASPGLVGELDELQIDKVARPAGYLKLAAMSQSGEKSAKLVTYAAGDEKAEAAKGLQAWLNSGSTTATLIGALTMDGWIVIGILFVMFLISWWVMIAKVRYLNGIAKGNARFMKEWKHVASDLTVLDHGEEEAVTSMGGRVEGKEVRSLFKSSVYRIYHIGAEEVRERMVADGKGNKGGAKILSSQSIHAIRARLDGGLVREKQKLDKLIVLLTICISGGPFLGLLGTVVGVMYTFAGIAAAGDVNVNAIAPGIAGALVATVAGLAVAIPALFGYNYILSRVKDATSDMHVFIDEFVTRMAEFYSH